MTTRARVRSRRTLAAATALGITAGLAAATAPAALAADAPAAPAADEVVLPNPGAFAPRSATVYHAGPTGYAYGEVGTAGLFWTDAATGTSTPVPTAAQYGHSGLYLDPAVKPGTIVDLATGARTPVTVPDGDIFFGAYTSDGWLTRTDKDGVTTALTLTRVKDGTATATPVTGITADTGMLALFGTATQDARGALLRARGSAVRYYLDYASATLTALPKGFESATQLRLSGDHVLGWSPSGNTLTTVPRADASATPVTTVAPDHDPLYATSFAVVGGQALFVRNTPSYDDRGVLRQKLRSVPLGGGPATDVLPAATTFLTYGTDGGVLAVGGSSAKDWAVHRITAAGDGTLRTATVRTVAPMPAVYSGIALGGGRLSYLADAARGSSPSLFDVDTAATGTPSATAPKLRQRLMSAPLGLRSLGDGESVFGAGSWVQAPTTENSFRSAHLPATATVEDAAGRYVLARNGATRYVADLDVTNVNDPEVPYTLTGPAALWADQVWKPGPAKGTVNSYNLTTKATSAAVNIGSGCTPSELQAVGRWLYWACSAEAKAGVYDRTAKKNVPVAFGMSLLGDGFVVRHDTVARKLLLTDATTGTTSDLAEVPAWADADERGTSWTVDKFGANVAFVDAQRAVHVKRVPVAPQPLTLLDTHSAQYDGGTTQLRWRASRAVGAWTVEIKNASGKTVRTYRGTTGNGAGVAVDWDSRDDLGRGVEDGQYTYHLTAKPANGSGADLRANGTLWAFDVGVTSLPGTYHPVAPTRLMDTRSGLGVPKGKVGADKTVTLQVTGTAPVPATGVTSVVLNVTATDATAGSFVSAYPSGTRRTSASNLNFTAGQTSANLVTLPVVDGKVHFYNRSGSVNLLADVAGYYTEGTGGSAYQPVTPKRLMDTRDGTGVAKGKVGAGGTVTLPVTEPDVTAVALNVTATNPTATSFVSVYPAGTARPSASNLNFTAGKTVPNLVIVPVQDGKITFYNRAGTVDLLADVAGYYKKGVGSVFTGSQPRRLLDTRDGTGLGGTPAKVGAGKTVSLSVGSRYSAVVLNITVTNPTAAGFVSAYPYGAARPSVSNLNFTAGQTVPNLVVVPVKDGQITLYNHTGSVDLIADLAGYYIG
ncbi:FlgD immunoglobulin-like domain containing protein [Streptomyces sp. NPDC048659]|uniref:FlgD immunoglobulin-like domain containing protein n=1 Tax=Streptomyces sp. NPDC048659 TaxID=3155489 RepID=UPI00341AF93A